MASIEVKNRAQDWSLWYGKSNDAQLAEALGLGDEFMAWYLKGGEKPPIGQMRDIYFKQFLRQQGVTENQLAQAQKVLENKRKMQEQEEMRRFGANSQTMPPAWS